MADNEKKDGGQTPERAKPKPGHETVAAPFDDIIDAILDADPKAVRKHMEVRRRRSGDKKTKATRKEHQRTTDDPHVDKPCG